MADMCCDLVFRPSSDMSDLVIGAALSMAIHARLWGLFGDISWWNFTGRHCSIATDVDNFMYAPLKGPRGRPGGQSVHQCPNGN